MRITASRATSAPATAALGLAPCLGLWLALAAPAAAQDGGGTEALVERIKQQLGEVDRALQEAADAEAVTDELGAARAAHLAVIRDIESLIEQVRYQRSAQCSSGTPQQGRQGDSPSGVPDAPQPAPRENDASGAPEPGSDPTAPEPEPGPEPTADDGEPHGGQPDRANAEQQGGRDPPPPETAPFTRQDTDARWGLLPPKMQERLMNLHVDDVPERYREWMDAYIRELNRLEQGDRRP
jgi:hypothetical protein